MIVIHPPEVDTPFKKGEVVCVVNREMVLMSLVKVAYAGPKVVRLDDGRRFRPSDGYWIGDNGIWPFPSIQHDTKANEKFRRKAAKFVKSKEPPQ